MNPLEQKIANLSDQSDFNNLHTILESLFLEYPELQLNPNFEKIKNLIAGVKDLNALADPIKHQILSLLSSGIAEKLQSNPSFQTETILTSHEMQELDHQLITSKSEKEKLNILQIFKKKQAAPDPAILTRLLSSPDNTLLKKNILHYFGNYISQDLFLKFLDPTCFDRDLHTIAIQISGIRNDIPIQIFEDLLANPKEELENRILIVELYSTRIKSTLFSQIILNPKEEAKLRRLAIQKANIRFDINLDFIPKLLLNKEEKLSLKEYLLTVFKNRILIEDIHAYLLAEHISLDEKYEILKLIADRYDELGKKGTLDILMLLMKEYKKGRKLLLSSHQISQECLKKLIFDRLCPDDFKIEILAHCEQTLSDQNHKELFEAIVKNIKTPFLFRIQILSDFKHLLSIKTVLEIIKNKEDAVDFRIAVLDHFQTELRENNIAKKLEEILAKEEESLLLKNYILKYFYKLMSKEVIFKFLLSEDINKPAIRKLLLSLKQVNFLTPKTVFFKDVNLKKSKPETALFLFENFLEYFEPVQLTQIMVLLESIRPLTKSITQIKNQKIRTALCEYILKDKKINISQKAIILKKYVTDLRGLFLCSLISDPDYPLELRKAILNHEPPREDLNEGGELDFIFLDKDENPEIRQLIYQKYRKNLNESTIRSVQQNPKEKIVFQD